MSNKPFWKTITWYTVAVVGGLIIGWLFSTPFDYHAVLGTMSLVILMKIYEIQERLDGRTSIK